MDPQIGKHIKLYLSSSYSEEDAQKIIDADNSNNDFLMQSYGMMDYASGMQENSYQQQAIANNEMALNLIRGGTVLPSFDGNTISSNIIHEIHDHLREQMEAIQLANPPVNSVLINNKRNQNDDESMFSPYMTKKQKRMLKQSREIHNYDPFVDQKTLVDPALQWMDMIAG